MSVKIRVQRPYLQTAKPLGNEEQSGPVDRPRLRPMAVPAAASAPQPFAAMLAECAATHRIDALRHQKVIRVRSRRVERQELQAAPQPQTQPRLAGASPLRRAFGWLRRTCVAGAVKQLRVAETVSLGDKRFVAIIHADGRKFLVGGGTQGVALLTPLGPMSDTAESRPSLMEFAEHSA